MPDRGYRRRDRPQRASWIAQGGRRSVASGKRVKVAEVGDVAVGEGRVIETEGRTLALFNVDGTFYAIDNTCPHRGGPLGEGDLDGRFAICPWHAWRWDVTTG